MIGDGCKVMGSSLKIDIGEEQVRGLVAEGILASLTEEKRTELIRAAVMHLLTPETVERRKRGGEHWQKEKVSLFQHIWEQEAEGQLRAVIRDQLETNEEFQNKLKGLFLRGVDLFLKDESSVTLVAEELARSFRVLFRDGSD